MKPFTEPLTPPLPGHDDEKAQQQVDQQPQHKRKSWLRALVIGGVALAAGVGITVAATSGNASSSSSSSISTSSSATTTTTTATTATTSGMLEKFTVATPSGSLTLQNRDIVEVSFKVQDGLSISSGARNNWVGVYCIANETDAATFATSDYIDYQYTYNATSGTLSFGPIINMRCAWQFRFVTQDNTVLATSELLHMANGDKEPLHVHLAMTSTATEMRVGWTSAKVDNPIVQYGTDKTNLTKSSVASATTYAAEDMCGWIASTVGATTFRDPGYMFDALMTDLVPGASYYYRVGEVDGEWSDVYSFVVPPQAGTSPKNDKSLSFFVFGDLAATASATSEYEVAESCGTTMKLIEQDILGGAHNYVAVMHDGDLSYAKGSTYLWDQFGFLIERVASKVAYMVSIGNHDYGWGEGNAINSTKYPANPLLEGSGETGWQSNGECGVPTLKRFHMPDNGNEEFWYSMDTGLAHHSVITAEMDFSVNSSMYNWLAKDLAAVDRTKTPWLFIHIHRPMYCSANYPQDYNITLQIREQVEPLAVQYNVNVVFSGHYHSYERTCAVIDGECVEADATTGETNAPIHIMVGSGGAYVDSSTWMDVSWSEARLQAYGYGRMHIHNASYANFEFVRNSDGEVTDSVWIQASASGSGANGRISSDGSALVSTSSSGSGLGTVYIVVIVVCSVVLFVVSAYLITRMWRKKPTKMESVTPKPFHRMEDDVV
ncbi:Inactive purple acid phosphatase 9, partial [Globisporangium splendens]